MSKDDGIIRAGNYEERFERIRRDFFESVAQILAEPPSDPEVATHATHEIIRAAMGLLDEYAVVVTKRLDGQFAKEAMWLSPTELTQMIPALRMRRKRMSRRRGKPGQWWWRRLFGGEDADAIEAMVTVDQLIRKARALDFTQ